MASPITSVHLVGSVPLQTAEEVFRVTSKELGRRLKHIPDGECGDRGGFIQWQIPLFARAPEMLLPASGQPPKAAEDAEVERLMQLLLSPIQTEYDSQAIASYKLFAEMQAKGTIDHTARFQVSIPTAINVLGRLTPQFRPLVEPLYEQALIEALRNMQVQIPKHKLAIQFDMALDIALLEGASPYGRNLDPWFEPVEDGVTERLLRLVAHVDKDVHLGLHMCYGNFGLQHFIEPGDLGKLVSLANAVALVTPRHIDWIHMPVPIGRDDVAYFTPLRDLAVSEQTLLYLGLIHAYDGEGTLRRIAAAHEVVDGFGISTECGMGRMTPEDMASVFTIAQNVVEEC